MSQYDKPHIPEHTRNGLAVANAGKPLAQHSENPEPILARLRNGESVAQVSQDLGISTIAFYAWAVRNCPDEFLAISAGRSLARIEEAEQTIDGAEDQLGVSKGRESARLAQWNLERANRKLFGDSKADSAGVVVQVLVQRDGETHTSIEHD
jgi:hypothetical protein